MAAKKKSIGSEDPVRQRPAWQIERLRKTLKFFKDKGEFAESRLMTWPGFCALVAVETGVVMDAERIRQFVEGVGDAERRYPTPLPARIEAIIETITKPDDPWITREALERPEYQTSPPVCIVELSGGDTGVSGEKLVGVFVGAASEQGEVETVELVFETSDLAGLVHVRERRARHLAESPQALEALSPFEEVLARESEFDISGWGILTAEDQILTMMRDVRTGAGHRWVLVGHADFWSDEQPIDRLVMLRQDYPYDLDHGEGAPSVADQIGRQVAGNVLTFTRKGAPADG